MIAGSPSCRVLQRCHTGRSAAVHDVVQTPPMPRIRLRIDPGQVIDGVHVDQRIRERAVALGKSVDWSCADEFVCDASNPKTCIG